MPTKEEALKLVDDFAALASCPSVWPKLDQATIAAGLKDRINDPDTIDQANTSFCGPADFARDIAEDDPVAYAKAVIDLFQSGRAIIGTFIIKPRDDLKRAPMVGRVHQTDWILLASIRDTDNWWFAIESPDDDASSMTLPHSKESWLKKAGYTDVINETGLTCKDLPNAIKASILYTKGYKVALFINSNMLKTAKMNDQSPWPDHWVALTSPISIKSFNIAHPGALVEDPSSSVKFTVYSWGNGHVSVPRSGTLTDFHFTSNYYGFIACRR
jgi:hypothetical protein